MLRGRPIKSQIRQNLVELLYFLKEGYGYGLWKTYIEIFPRCTLRSIHYHLKKGLQTDEFKVKQIKQEKGNYSWGGTVEKTYYELGPQAKPTMKKEVKEFLEKKKK